MDLFFKLDRLEIVSPAKKPTNPLAMLIHGQKLEEDEIESEPIVMLRATFFRESLNDGDDVLDIYLPVEESHLFQVGKEYKITISD